MKYIQIFILLSTLNPFSFAGNEAGGNGNAIGAFFTRAGHVLFQKMEEKETGAPPYIKEFPAAKFKSVLGTRVAVLDKSHEHLLTNEFGEVMEVKVSFDTPQKKPIIFVRGALWSDYLNKLAPHYRMVLHAYLYAAGLDDSAYEYSSLVPIESLGLIGVLPDEAKFHEFERPIGLSELKQYARGYFGITTDRKKVLHFDLNGLLTWEHEAKGRTFTHVTKHFSSDVGFLFSVEKEPVILRLEENGTCKNTFACERTYAKEPDALAMDSHFILRKHYLLFYPNLSAFQYHHEGDNYFRPMPCVRKDVNFTNVVKGSHLEEAVYAGYLENEKRVPYLAVMGLACDGPYEYLPVDSEGEFNMVAYSREMPDYYSAGYFIEKGRKLPFLGRYSKSGKSSLSGGQSLAERYRIYLPLKEGETLRKVTGLALSTDRNFVSVTLTSSAGNFSRIYFIGGKEIKSRDFPDSEIYSLIVTQDRRLLISTESRIVKMAFPE